MNVELLTIGDELLLGFTVDTNSAWMARALASVGITIARRTSVGDDAEAIAAAVRDALARTGAVITTGGLGPTSDDQTKPAIAALFGRQLEPNEELWERLRALWRERGRPGEIPASNRQQIMIPAGARILHNRHGTAPGIWIENEASQWCAMLPGVPREMRGMFEDTLLPLLLERGGARSSIVLSRAVRTTGVAESMLPDLLGDAAREVLGLPVAYLPSQEGVDLRLTARDLPEAEARSRLDAGVATIRERVGRFAYAEDNADLAEIVLERCRERGYHIAVGESCTGGLLGARLTAIPGSSDVFLGGVIAYDDRIKRELLAVPDELLRAEGAVSESVARAMAAGARARLSAEIGVGITGIAGPGGGSPEKPVGLVWIAVDIGGAQRVHGSRFIGDRAEIRFRASQSALEMIRRGLAG